MPIYYSESGSIDRIEVTSSLRSTSTSTINFQGTVTLSGSFSGSFRGSGANFTDIHAEVFKSTVSSSALTGTVSETLATSVLIPANTFTTGSIIYMQARTLKTGTNGTNTMRFYFNTSAAVGGTQIGLYTGGATTTFAQIARTAAVKSTGQTEHFNVNAISDYGGSSTGYTTSTINWAVDQYFVISLTNASTLDSSRVSFYRLFGV